MSEKNILEQALLQINTLEEAVKQNAKGILASTMKEELKDLLKESLEDEDETHPMDEVAPEEEEKDMSDDESAEDETADDEAEDTEDLDNAEPTKGIDDMDSEEGEDETDMTDFGGDTEDDEEGEDETGSDDFGGDTEDDDVEDDDDVMDMTNASDDEVVKVFRAMKPEDGIVVKKDGNKVEFHDGEHDYIIKIGRAHV